MLSVVITPFAPAQEQIDEYVEQAEESEIDGDEFEDSSLESENISEQSSEIDEGVEAIKEALGQEDKENLSLDVDENIQYNFPNDSSKWTIQTHVLSFKEQNEKLIDQCKNEVKQISENSRNHQALLLASSQLQSIIRSAPKSYHQCFFHLISSLDLLLDKTGLSFDRKMQGFLTKMNELWVFSTAMAKFTGNKKYIELTKERYINYSRQYFGRTLETIGQPLSH